MFGFSIKSNFDQVEKALADLGPNQVPFATSLALNRVAQLAVNTIRTQMNIFFDRPTPYTLNSLTVKYATKTKLTARVEHKLDAGKGTPASKYLRPEIEGGSRNQKHSEKVLCRLVGMPDGYLIPGAGAPLDAYGNVRGSLITQILSALGGLSESGFTGNRTKASAARKGAALKEYFVINANNARGKKPGIYRRDSTRIVSIFFVVPKVQYEVRYHMEDIVARVRDAEYGRQFNAAMDYALSTAKLKFTL